MSSCPNPNDEDWKYALSKVGKAQSYRYFVKNGDNIPSKQQIDEGLRLQAEINAKLDETNKHLILDEKDQKYRWMDKLVPYRFSQKAKEWGNKLFGNRIPTEKEEHDWSIRQKAGTTFHKAAENIINSIIKGEKISDETKNLTYFKVLNEYLINFTNGIKADDENAIIKLEQKVYNGKDTGGAMDILVLHTDGSARIYDFKTTKFNDGTGKVTKEEVEWYKLEEYEQQVSLYKNALIEKYGIKEFRETRIIPVHLEFRKSGAANDFKLTYVITKFDIGGTKDKPHLDMIPVANELTGNSAIDKLLTNMLEQYDRLRAKKGKDDKDKEAIKIIHRNIKRLQLYQDINAIIDDGKFEFTRASELMDKLLSGDYGENNENRNNFDEYYKKVQFYSNIGTFLGRDFLKDLDEVTEGKLASMQLSMSTMLNEMNKWQEDNLREIANENGIVNYDDLQKQTGMWVKLWRHASQIQHPIIQTFLRLVNKANSDTETYMRNLQAELKEVMKDIPKNGFATYDAMLQFKDGKKTGKTLNQFKSEYYDKKKEITSKVNISQEDLKWLKDNTVFNKAAFEIKKLERFKYLEGINYTSDKAKNAKIVKEKQQEWENKYNIDKTNAAYNKDNYFLKPTANWETEQWKNLQNNKPMLAFYKLYTKVIKELSGNLPVDIKGNFIPNIHKHLMEEILDNGSTTIKGLKNIVTLGLKINDKEDENDEDNIPHYFTTEIAPEEKSYNLGEILILYADMASNFKNKHEIEFAAKMCRNVIETREEIETDKLGRIKHKSISPTEMETKKGINKNSLEQFNDFYNYFMFDIKTKTKDKSIFGYSRNALIRTGMKYFSAKSLTLNTVSAGANFAGGWANIRIMAAKGRYFNSSHINKAKLDMTRGIIGNEIVHSLKEYFDIEMDSSAYTKAKEFSVSAITKHANIDKFYFLHKIGDKSTQETILLAMLHSHTIKDGKIIRISKSDKESKSISQLAKIVDDKLIIDGLTNKELLSFRSKIKGINGAILGNMSQQDINTIGMTLQGQALMNFRKWIPATIDERFGELRYNYATADYNLGRYRVFWGEIAHKHILNNIKDTILPGLLFFSKNFGESESSNKRAKYFYDKYLEENPKLKDRLSFEDYKQLRIEELRGMLMELRLTLGMLGLIIALGLWVPDDDKDEGWYRYTHKMISRFQDELSFYYSPPNFTDMIRSPIPGVNLLEDIFSLFSNSFGQGIDYLQGDEEGQKKYKPLLYLKKLTIGINGVDNLIKTVDKKYQNENR